MKFTTFSIWLLTATGYAIGAVLPRDNSQAAASREIEKLQKQYNDYIEETIRTRYSGCTPDNILYRQEW